MSTESAEIIPECCKAYIIAAYYIATATTHPMNKLCYSLARYPPPIYVSFPNAHPYQDQQPFRTILSFKATLLPPVSSIYPFFPVIYPNISIPFSTCFITNHSALHTTLVDNLNKKNVPIMYKKPFFLTKFAFVKAMIVNCNTAM